MELLLPMLELPVLDEPLFIVGAAPVEGLVVVPEPEEVWASAGAAIRAEPRRAIARCFATMYSSLACHCGAQRRLLSQRARWELVLY
jgi:hypothetical protein